MSGVATIDPNIEALALHHKCLGIREGGNGEHLHLHLADHIEEVHESIPLHAIFVLEHHHVDYVRIPAVFLDDRLPLGGHCFDGHLYFGHQHLLVQGELPDLAALHGIHKHGQLLNSL